MIAPVLPNSKKNREPSHAFVAGLDISLRASGVCIGRPGGWEAETLRNKLRGDWLRDQIRDRVYKVMPALVAIEGYSCDSIGKWFDIGEGGGVVKLMLYELGIPVIIVPPKSLKRFVTGNGSADKELVIREVERKYGVKTEDDNIADAVGLAQAAWVWLTQQSKYRVELEVVQQIRLPHKSSKVRFSAVKDSL
jgi:Holliday junction resolvasome RuvABC endonuclease subunit